jgi:hypothetical protein
MYAIITNMVLAAVALMVVQAETYALLEAVAYARKQDGSLMRKIRLGGARYEWASVLWHETSVERPAYSISRPLVLFLVTVFAAVALMDIAGLPGDGPLGMLMGLAVSIGYFFRAYGASFTAHREHVAECQKLGTWNLA